MGFGMHLVFDLISLNITPFSGLPSLPSYQMYSALCVSAFTRTTTVRPCVVWVVSWTWRDVSQNRRADDHHRKWSVKFVSNQVYVPGEHLGQCTRPCGTQKRPESRFRDIRRESWEAPAREIGDCPGGESADVYYIRRVVGRWEANAVRFTLGHLTRETPRAWRLHFVGPPTYLRAQSCSNHVDVIQN